VEDVFGCAVSQSYKFIPHISVCVRLLLFRQMRAQNFGEGVTVSRPLHPNYAISES
jgi:hypothetical protein